jgi:Fe-S-cluster-containing dehydrogenase component
MTRYGMVIDVTRCDGCYNCFLVCKDEYAQQAHAGYTAAQPMTGQEWMKILPVERGQFPKVKQDYIPLPCMHCETAPCTEDSEGAIHRRPDGIVMIDPEGAIGQQDVPTRCPYWRISWNEKEQVPQKCTFCAHLLDAGWKDPRCVEACPTGTLIFGDLDDPNSAVSQAWKKAEAMHPEYNLGESVRYIGLPRNFVAGSVAYADEDECAQGVTVELLGADGTRTTQTDAFGDFEFEGLPDDQTYSVTVVAPGYRSQRFDVKTLKSLYLGDIMLERQ